MEHISFWLYENLKGINAGENLSLTKFSVESGMQLDNTTTSVLIDGVQ